MPKKKASFFSDFLKELEKNKIEKGKPVAQIDEKNYFLITCAGKKTEPIYFEHLRDLLPEHLVETIEVMGQGANTLAVVKTAIQKRDARLENPLLPPYTEVWAVFDKDDFPAKNFDNAVAKAKASGIEPGITNECFELWYLLHFRFLDTAIKREQYFETLSDILKFKYGKDENSSKKIVEQLFEKGKIRRAIKWAEKLETQHAGKTPSDSCPYTRVHILVKKLLDYAKYEY